MPLKPEVEKNEWICSDCKTVLKRKPTELIPQACNYCHTGEPWFTLVGDSKSAGRPITTDNPGVFARPGVE